MKTLAWTLTAIALAAMVSIAPVEASNCGDRTDLVKQRRVDVIGLTADQRLVSFNECRPDRTRIIGHVQGLQGTDTALVGIDFRVQDGKLYGVGNGGGVYTVSVDTAAAVLVSQLTIALDGTIFGVDFNPAADRLRIISNTGQNLRHNVNAGGVTVMDTALNYTVGTPASGLTGAAYTNNDLDPTTGTTLFDVDTNLNQIAIQSPPNNGSLVATGQLTVDPDTPVGFDIYTSLADGVAVTNSGFASLSVGAVLGFYRVNFLTGKAILIDYFDEPVVDIAIPLDKH
jgi:Domain of unknown function (DUF4394)